MPHTIPSARFCALLLAIVIALPLSSEAARRSRPIDPTLKLRARIVRLTPEEPARIHWRYGGEGLGGNVTSGELTAVPPPPPEAPSSGVLTDGTDDADLPTALLDKPTDRIIVPGDAVDFHYLKPGVWSPAESLLTLGRGASRRFITLTLSGYESERNFTNTTLDVEILHGDRSLKQFRIEGPDGPTFGVYLPLHRLDDAGAPTETFIEEVGGLLDYARRRQAALRAMPWADQPTPKRYAMVSDCGGYKARAGYGSRTTDPETVLTEFGTLRLMGINGTRSCPDFVLDLIRRGEGIGAELQRARITSTMGYPIPTIDRGDGRPPFRDPGDGCPYLPANISHIAPAVEQSVARLREQARDLPVDELWALTIDEIGTVFDRAPEGKDHMGACEYCRKAFRELIRSEGGTPADFGASDWEPIRATYGYWTVDFWESKRRLETALTNASARLDRAASSSFGASADGVDSDVVDVLINELDDNAKTSDEPLDPGAAVEAAKARYDRLIWKSDVITVPEEDRDLQVSDAGWTRLVSYSRRFNNLSSAKLFNPLREAIASENTAKQAAMARGDTDDPAARQAWMYSYALRGNTFLMRGHSLDFFEFYRFADNAFMYETSNRDPRVWQWDSYLCDVGRSLNRHYGQRFGIIVKPHRGAPIQRALAAVARGVRLIYWYTYGPEWSKGDSFAGRQEVLERIGWFARMLAKAEDTTYDAEWAMPAEVAIVRPRTALFHSGSASWENGKWVYTALMHSHIPVMALDEQLLLAEDLSRFKAIVICGSHVRRSVAEKLRTWVDAGGVLVADGWGMARDEGGEDLELLWPVFGLAKRDAVDVWSETPGYGATRLGAVSATRDAPGGARVALGGTDFLPAVGREMLIPDGAAVQLSYADGSAAVTRHRFGQGEAWLNGLYSGLEYAIETMADQPFDADKRALVARPLLEAGIRPVVDASDPLVEGILLKNPVSGRHAVILINWRHEADNVRVAVRGVDGARQARSLATDTDYPLARTDDGHASFTLPHIAEGDIVLLD